MTTEEIIAAMEKDAVFYRRSGGGVTFSGGEPFAQPERLRHLVQASAFLGIPTAVETSGYFAYREVADIFETIDEVYVDLKHIDDNHHRDLTGVSNQGILDNIRRLDGSGVGLTIRVPLIENLTDTEENIDGIAAFCARLNNLAGVELLPYHNYGAAKYRSLDLPYDDELRAPDLNGIQSVLDRFKARGIGVTVMGNDAVK
jgi:pyruvate formate lyase activating enzyme